MERERKNKMEAELSQSAESSSGVKSNERSRKAWGVWAYGKGGIRVLGTVWFGGLGGKARMKEHAALSQAKSYVAITEPDSGNHGFACYATWEEAERGLQPLKGQSRHVFEVIGVGRPCKPYLDVDGREEDLTDGLRTAEEVIARVESATRRVFLEDFRISLQESDFVWTRSGGQAKLSLHLVISSHSPQYVYTSNLKREEQGAHHLARRIVEVDAELGRLVDDGVYTTDREMRMCGSSKYEKKASVLTTTKEGVAQRDTVITWLDEDVEELRVPCRVPQAVKAKRRVKTVRELTAAGEGVETTWLRERMLELVRRRIHPTADQERKGDEDPWNMKRGLKYNYTDRSEKCYSGVQHRGVQNFRCWVDEHEDVWMKCFSTTCNQKAHMLGNLHEEPRVWLEGAIEVDMQYLKRNRGRRVDLGVLGLEEVVVDGDSERKFNVAVDKWMAGEFKALNIRCATNWQSVLSDAGVREVYRGTGEAEGCV